MPVIRGVGSVRQCFREENYSVHKPFKEEAAYINMRLVFVNSCQLFTNAPGGVSLNRAVLHFAMLSVCPLVLSCSYRPAACKTSSFAAGLERPKSLLQQKEFFHSFLTKIPRSPCCVRLGPGPSALCSGEADALVVESQTECKTPNMGKMLLQTLSSFWKKGNSVRLGGAG